MIENISVKERIAPLRVQYKEAPETAWGTNSAKTIGDDLADPYHGNMAKLYQEKNIIFS